MVQKTAGVNAFAFHLWRLDEISRDEMRSVDEISEMNSVVLTQETVAICVIKQTSHSDTFVGTVGRQF